MLLEFTVGNFRSINKKCTLSMLAQSITDTPKDNITTIGWTKILKTAAIYGANSSGKTNFVWAMNNMKKVITYSVKLNDNDKLDYTPFLLTTEKDKPSIFEIIFLVNEVIYRYGFELTASEIVDEWLFSSTKKNKENVLFIRNKDGIAVNEQTFPEGVDKEQNTNNNRLFLSLCGQLGGVESKLILNWFTSKFNIISGIEGAAYYNYSKKMFHKQLDGCEDAKSFFKLLQLGFNDLETVETEFDPSSLPNNLPDDVKDNLLVKLNGKKRIDFYSKHPIYNKKGEFVKMESFDIDNMESDGTKKLIQLSGPIFDTLKNGSTLIVDELDAKMHPLISQYIIKLFNDPKTNPNNAQLIFTTHDTHLLSSKLLRRDQVWFAEKDKIGQTDLYNMMDIILPDGSKPRNDANYEKNYIAGRYGAIPYILND